MRSFHWFSSLPLSAVVMLTAVPELGATQVVQGHQYEATLVETGARLYGGQCAVCHGANGAQIAGADLRRGEAIRSMSDDRLRETIRGGNVAAGMPQFDLPREDLDALVAFIRAGLDIGGTAVRIGEPERGLSIFEGEGNCTRCHSVDGRRAGLAPDLSDIGARRDAEYLQRALLDPDGAMLPINRPVRVVSADGAEIRGRRLNEDTYTVQLVDTEGRLLSLAKSDLREFEVMTESPMPSVADTLTPDQVADLVAYLLSLGRDR
jgi:putative heme-binding domain-containing protein